MIKKSIFILNPDYSLLAQNYFDTFIECHEFAEHYINWHCLKKIDSKKSNNQIIIRVTE
jgi:hypothetical protein